MSWNRTRRIMMMRITPVMTMWAFQTVVLFAVSDVLIQIFCSQLKPPLPVFRMFIFRLAFWTFEVILLFLQNSSLPLLYARAVLPFCTGISTHFQCHSGSPASTRSFSVLFYGDRYCYQQLSVWNINVHSAYRININAIQSQLMRIPLAVGLASKIGQKFQKIFFHPMNFQNTQDQLSSESLNFQLLFVFILGNTRRIDICSNKVKFFIFFLLLPTI